MQLDLFATPDGSTPTAPHNHTPTSIISAGMIRGAIVQGWVTVLGAIYDCGQAGATRDEIERMTGLKHQTASARTKGLKDREMIVDTDERRLTRSGHPAAVMQLTEKGRETLEEIRMPGMQ